MFIVVHFISEVIYNCNVGAAWNLQYIFPANRVSTWLFFEVFPTLGPSMML